MLNFYCVTRAFSHNLSFLSYLYQEFFSFFFGKKLHTGASPPVTQAFHSMSFNDYRHKKPPLFDGFDKKSAAFCKNPHKLLKGKIAS
jgi:hypothetical protein